MSVFLAVRRRRRVGRGGEEEEERRKKRKTIWDPKAKIVEIDGVRFRVKPAFDIFWKYTSERHALEERRRRGESEP